MLFLKYFLTIFFIFKQKFFSS